MEYRTNRNGIIYMSIDGETFSPLGEVKGVELTCDPKYEEEYVSCFYNTSGTLTIEGRLSLGSRLFLRTGKELFMRFPKKIKRSRKWLKFIKDIG